MQTPSYPDILAAILTDYANLIPGADTSPGSDIYARAAALASTVWGAYNHQNYISRQILPDTCDSATLDRHAAIHGLSRLAPSFASGTIACTGSPDGTAIPAGTIFTTGDGTTFISTANTVIAGGTAAVAASAVTAGISGNIPNGTALTVQNPPPGINSTATPQTAFTGGTDRESDSALLTRLLNRLQAPPAGGNANDFRQWALTVPGVTDAMVFPLRLGLGSTSVVVLTGGTGAARIPGSGLITAVTDYINSVRPVGNQILQVFGPTAQSQAVTVGIHLAAGYSFTPVQAQVSAAITAYLGSLMPLQTMYISRLMAVVMTVPGVAYCTITTPAADVVAADGGGTAVYMIVPGAITVNQI